MGGAAYLIPGVVAPHLVPTAPIVVSPRGHRLFEIAAGALKKQLPADFKSWLAHTLPVPWPATTIVLEYVDQVRPSVYVRGSQEPAEAAPKYYVQMSFSGCAGEAEVSASLCAHWAACWHRAKHDVIGARYLLPFGFTAHAIDGALADVHPRFVPADKLGYLEVADEDSRRRHGLPLFSLDHAWSEAYDGDPILADLDERFGPLVTDGRCHCQICEGRVAAR